MLVGSVLALVGLTAAAVAGLVSPLIPLALAIGLAIGLIIRAAAAWSRTDPPATRSRLSRILGNRWLLLIAGLAIASTALALVGIPLYQISDSILARAPYRGSAELSGTPESWRVQHQLEIDAETIENLVEEGYDVDAIADAVRAEGWEIAELLGGGWQLRSGDTATGPKHLGVSVAATSEVPVPALYLSPDDQLPMVIVEPAAGSSLSLRAPRGAVHSTSPASSAATAEPGGLERRIVELDPGSAGDVVVDVVRPGLRGSPAAQLVGLTPWVVVSGALSLAVGVGAALKTKVVEGIVAWVLRLFGRRPKAVGPAPAAPPSPAPPP